MKWQNKGHEFDALGAIFKKNKNLLVIGNDESLKSIKEELDFLNTKIEYKTLKEVFSIPILSGFKLKNKTIVIADNSQETLEKLKKFKFIKHNENLFLADHFLKKYLSIYALYVHNKMYIGTTNSVVITTNCSLNCKYCGNYQPYIKNKQHKDIDEIKKDIDIFFSCFDRVKHFSLSGGEPLLNKNIGEIIEYIFDKYDKKIFRFEIPTNGSVVPSKELFDILKNDKIYLICGNYTKNAPHIIDSYNKLIEKCKELSINYETPDNNNMVFFKSFPPKEDYSKYTEEQLRYRYAKCKSIYSGQEIINGKLYSCCLSANADTANLIKSCDYDVLDLNKYYAGGGGYSKNELIEFRLDYCEKGYLEFCKYCNGFFGMENDWDENGVTQLKRGEILEWDINNPTYL